MRLTGTSLSVPQPEPGDRTSVPQRRPNTLSLLVKGSRSTVRPTRCRPIECSSGVVAGARASVSRDRATVRASLERSMRWGPRGRYR